MRFSKLLVVAKRGARAEKKASGARRRRRA